MYYLIENNYIGSDANIGDTPTLERTCRTSYHADTINIGIRPMMVIEDNRGFCTLDSGERWSGRYGDFSSWSHGKYKTLDAAINAMVEIFGNVSEFFINPGNNDPYECTASFKPGKSPAGLDRYQLETDRSIYKQCNELQTIKYLMDREHIIDSMGRRLLYISHKSTDGQLRAGFASAERTINKTGFTLDYDAAWEFLSKVRGYSQILSVGGKI